MTGTLRRIGGEPVMWLGAQRALLLQLADPQVAAGVEHHSTFRRHPELRLWGTADTMLLMVWGRPHEAATARARVMAIHDHVHGHLAGPAGDRPAGLAYSAHDPSLLAWVWSTLVATSEHVHERYVGGLGAGGREDLYRDWVAFARFFGIPDRLLPADRRSFREAWASQLARLAVGDDARELAGAVLDPPLWWAPRALKDLGARVAVGLLPAGVRARYGFNWTTDDELALARFDRNVRRWYHYAPQARVRLPELYLAGRRAMLALTPPTNRDPFGAGRGSRPVTTRSGDPR